ncbi:YtxH domain-containing protein [Cytobacillus purgationiresistens]|uniref:Gas vesicle protein n=1 Tax=Cytobacillus purgationiresistens TaxID=863449 RepID=A0ABU0ACG2_9BACI|nr:YtxH domain-containing protein [Cytobacillus purgationiresistens]MDQ0268937.1 gas vesicle protein [Cytobacillus purgationiresistens]
MKAKSLFLGLLVGGTAASVAALLSAPASGKETRKYISIQSKVFASQMSELNDQLSVIKKRLVHVGHEGKEAMTALTTDMVESINQWKADILPHQKELQKELQNIEKSIAELEATLDKKK